MQVTDQCRFALLDMYGQLMTQLHTHSYSQLGEGGDSGEGDEEDNDESTSGGVAHPVTSASKKKKKKKKTKKKYEPEQVPMYTSIPVTHGT